MKRCNEIHTRMTFCLDDELRGSELAALEAHLRECEACSELFESERRFLETIRGFRPLHSASPELRARVEQVLSEAPPPHTATPRLRQRVRHSLGRRGSSTPGSIKASRAVAMTAVVALALLLGAWGVIEYRKRSLSPPSDFAMMAVDTHQRRLRGQLPLEVVSEIPERVSGWFAGKLPFAVTLPNYQESSGQEKLYGLEGARLVGYKNDYAAYVAYQMRMRPIGLVVTSAAVAQPSGGEEIVSKGIAFHYDSIQGLKVISWSDRGLTYALVSDLEERGQQSCIVCHQGTKDRDFVEILKPR